MSLARKDHDDFPWRAVERGLRTAVDEIYLALMLTILPSAAQVRVASSRNLLEAVKVLVAPMREAPLGELVHRYAVENASRAARARLAADSENVNGVAALFRWAAGERGAVVALATARGVPLPSTDGFDGTP